MIAKPQDREKPKGFVMQIPSAKPDHPTDSVYLDFAAATPMDPRVVDAMIPYFTEKFYNPSAPYALSRQIRDEVERVQET